MSKIGKIKLKQNVSVDTDLTNLNIGKLDVKHVSKVAYKLLIQRDLLKNLYEMKHIFKFPLTTFLNDLMPTGILPVRENVVRLEKHLGKLVSETVSKFTKLEGRKKYEYLHERVKVLVLCDETCTLKEIQIQERNRLETELNSRVHELYVEIVNLQNKINKVENEKQEVKRMLQR